MKRIVGSLWLVPRWIVCHPMVLVTLILVVMLKVSSYDATRTAIYNNRASCQRGQRSTFDNMEFNYGAYVARSSTVRRLHETARSDDAQAAADYLAIIRDQMTRVNADHSLVWPNPLVPNVRGPFRHPLGLGTFSCVGANLMPSFFQF